MKQHITKLRVIAWVLLSLLPFAAIGLGVILVTAHTVINVTYILGYILLPLLTMLLLMFLVFSERTVWVKVILSIVLLAVFLFLFHITNFFGKLEHLEYYNGGDAEENYVEIAGDTDPMPGLSELGNPETIEYYDYYSVQAIFMEEVDVLIGIYNDADYIEQKNLIEEKYVFQNVPMTIHEYTCEPEVEIDGYVFRMLSVNGEYSCKYPKYLTFIATNDAAQEIVYMSYRDVDLDYITSLDEFIKNNCGWKYIR